MRLPALLTSARRWQICSALQGCDLPAESVAPVRTTIGIYSSRMSPLVVAWTALFALSCAASTSTSNTMTRIPRSDSERAVAAVLDDWHDAAAHADEDRYFGHFAPNGVFLGTDATERWTVSAFRTYAHPHFARGRAWNFRATRRAVDFSDDGQVAWFDEDLDGGRLGPVRGSGVLLRNTDGHWRIAQYNLALTVPNERFDAVRTAIRGTTPGDAGVHD